MKIVIIGAGPVGSYAGYLLAKSGHNVEIYENHPQVGLPIQCTGILTSDFDQFHLPMDNFLVNIITVIEAYSPSNEKVSVNQKDYIVCRKRFDNYLANLAIKEGASVFVNHCFLRKEQEKDKEQDKEQEKDVLIIRDTLNKIDKKISADITIAADGPLSPTAKAFGFFHTLRKNYYGIQGVVEGQFESKVTKTYFGNTICPGFFAWVVPESSTIARIGLYAEKDSQRYFTAFMNEHGFKAKEMQAGTIPIFSPEQKLQNGNCYVIGDASSYVKATTGGGIIPGMKQAEILADCINHGKIFDVEVRTSGLRRKMRLHLLVGRMMSKFSDDDWNRMFKYFNQEKVRKVLEKYTRDNPVPMLFHILLREPRFLYFMKFLRV